MAFGDTARRLAGGVARDVASSPYGQLGGMVQQGRAAGFFDPLGSPRLRRLREARALRRGANRRRRGDVMGQLFGLDPNASRFAAAQTDADIAGDTSNFLNDAAFQEEMGNQAYFRDLFGQHLGIAEQRRREYEERREARRRRRGAFLGGLGSLAGQAGLAALTGGASVPFTASGAGPEYWL